MMPRSASLLMLAVMLTGCASSHGQSVSVRPYVAPSGTIEDCMDSDCGDIIMSLTRQSEADSLTIRELEIRLYWSDRKAQDGRPSFVERFMARYGFAVGAAVGVYVGAAAAR